MDAGVRLIALRGFAAVTVGDIESEAGFTRRGGTMYRHFESKEELLVEAVRRHVDSLSRSEGLADLLPLPDRRSELQVLGRWILQRLTAEEQISKVIEKEAGRLPQLADLMRDGISEPGYRLMSAYLTERGLADSYDADATAVVLLGALVNARRSEWTFGAPPAGVTDERLVGAWVSLVDVVLTTVQPGTRRNTRSTP